MSPAAAEWREWDCPEADLDELRMVDHPSHQLRLRIAGYLSATILFKRAMVASRGQLLHLLDAYVDKQHTIQLSELQGVAQ